MIEEIRPVQRDPADMIRAFDYPAYLAIEHADAKPASPDTITASVEAILKARPTLPVRYANGTVNAPRIAHVVNAIALRAEADGLPPAPTDADLAPLDPTTERKFTWKSIW